jgi:hypothetical protein
MEHRVGSWIDAALMDRDGELLDELPDIGRQLR